ncbi:hypothetical protein BKP35_08200 [Anaerobacillus arseniciselenatis]|uniref:Inner membrane protein YgaP-like transmembrane domain-containing protein n=1 Tax=Anaerobacillus arseniciselenatis TaxID=85682 RepID=A0A1S2LP65_9BACI|nr:DUF2892 domain-containing protein [Anaerobacillus arseniciselenatis]OIJ14166.1 hypothetical protein BKP35_08200 [Anaerobacillus arseniciselenatis]
MKKITPNIGLLNSFIRLTCGFTMLAWGTSKLVKRPFSNSPIIAIVLGAMKVAEGFTRFCPLTFLFEERMEELAKEGDIEAPDTTEKSYDDLINPS